MTHSYERLKVSSTTRPQTLAGAIAKYITKDRKHVEVVAVGASAINQAVKGQILARRFVSTTGINLAFIPAFETIDIDGSERTAVKWRSLEV